MPRAMRRWIAWLGFGMATCHAAAVFSAETWDLQARAGVTQPELIEVPDQPEAALVLFAGGDRGVVFASNDVVSYRANFLLRSRADFLEHGFIVTTFEAPSSRPAPNFLDDSSASRKSTLTTRGWSSMRCASGSVSRCGLSEQAVEPCPLRPRGCSWARPRTVLF